MNKILIKGKNGQLDKLIQKFEFSNRQKNKFIFVSREEPDYKVNQKSSKFYSRLAKIPNISLMNENKTIRKFKFNTFIFRKSLQSCISNLNKK